MLEKRKKKQPAKSKTLKGGLGKNERPSRKLEMAQVKIWGTKKKKEYIPGGLKTERAVQGKVRDSKKKKTKTEV